MSDKKKPDDYRIDPAKIAQIEHLVELPDLRGSDKQRKWAREIRARSIFKFLEDYPSITVARLRQASTLGLPEGRILRSTDAHAWIQARKSRIHMKLAKDFGFETNPFGNFSSYNRDGDKKKSWGA